MMFTESMGLLVIYILIWFGVGLIGIARSEKDGGFYLLVAMAMAIFSPVVAKIVGVI